MHELDLRNIDLNLLVTLDALLTEKSVTRAAERLGMSQPAVSRALGRLRVAFSDSLLAEDRKGYCLSPRAEEIRPVLRRILSDIGSILDSRPFDPAEARGVIRLLMPDLEAAALGPHILTRFAAEAPGLDLEILPLTDVRTNLLEDDAADALVGVVNDAPAAIHRRALYDDHYVCLMRTGHPMAGRQFTLREFLDMDHIVVAIGGVGPSMVDDALVKFGHRRHMRVRVPSFLAAVEIAARTDMILTLPSVLARTAATTGRLIRRAPPLELKPFTMSLLWHARHRDDPRHRWLRSIMVDAAGTFQNVGLGGEPAPGTN